MQFRYLAFIVSLCGLLQPSTAADIYVGPNGSDNGDGSITSPLASIQAAVDAATAGTVIYLRGGTYAPTSNIQITAVSGRADAPITIASYEGEKVIIDGENLPGTPAELDASLPNGDRGIFHIENVDYWRFIDLELINGPYGIYARDASNNYYERLITRDNYESGFQLQGASSNNVVLYLDSYGNRDPRKNGESADGFACKEGSGEGNILRGARLWNNVDDGLDLWEFKSAVTIEDTLAWGNGFNRWDFDDFQGDGNGFKLGGGDASDIGPANHIIRNCIAFSNAAKGFTDNKQPGNFLLSHNTAWDNAHVGFQITTAAATLERNVAVANNNGGEQVSLKSGTVEEGNSWNESGAGGVSFESTDVSLVQGEREESGKIVASGFLLPVDGADIGATTHW
ncbi:hypothetical protein AJ80_00578 [Polytolypa hystricis UAMH7299]|uniref:Pel9A-like right handed beta-helix region domain-containing protein n=1 Tax=Polytolypa hystricis (strain UAMH7299) TaxID=1447883 RepID=A0A2B7Z310_POLH7|nr:hypothetical protein AJ80_00578 [Polytolypa hystricis UAMH7299]